MDYDFLFRISVCFLLSFLIGIERQYRRRIIGLRTTILVSIGAFLFVTYSINVGSSDISRIASGVVSGIGFLGAGVILKDGKKIRGLTTAATLWCVAGIGVLCAGGAILESVAGTIIILFSNIILRYVNKLVNNVSGNKDIQIEINLNVVGNNKNIDKVKKELEIYFKENKFEIINKKISKEIMDYNLSYNFLIKKVDIDNINNIEKILTESKPKSFSITKIGEVKIDEFED